MKNNITEEVREYLFEHKKKEVFISNLKGFLEETNFQVEILQGNAIRTTRYDPPKTTTFVKTNFDLDSENLVFNVNYVDDELKSIVLEYGLINIVVTKDEFYMTNEWGSMKNITVYEK